MIISCSPFYAAMWVELVSHVNGVAPFPDISKPYEVDHIYQSIYTVILSRLFHLFRKHLGGIPLTYHIIRKFPEIEVPINHLLKWGFSIINHPFVGTPH